MKIKVVYWVGTTQYKGEATTYRGALRIASRNRNAFPARFYDEHGAELYDVGCGLSYESGSELAV